MPASPARRSADNPSTLSWWHEAVLYHVYVASFLDSSGDGFGDLAGVIDALPYLDEILGVDALWISPFFVSPFVDGGYDISDHTAVDPRFGDLSTFDRLLNEAHRRALKVIIDYVPNHTSDQNPWFLESRSSLTSEKRSWYVWADSRPGETYPNNLGQRSRRTRVGVGRSDRQFYLHSHLVEQPDVNWRNPGLHAAMLSVLAFWLDRGVDGFRIDVAHMLMKDPELNDNPPNPAGKLNPYDRQHADFNTQLHLNDRHHPDLHGVLRDMRRLIDSYGERIAIGELDVMPWSEWAEYYGADLDELHLPLNFQLIETPWKARDVRMALEELESALPPGAWAVNNLGNHDRSRIASRYGQSGARLAAIMLLTARGTPLLYYGDELGMSDVSIPSERLRDGYSRRDGGPTRDPNRSPMQWSDADNAGFNDGGVEPWLPLAPDWRERNVQAELEDPRSVLNLYRRLIELRRRSSALRAGSIHFVDPAPYDCLVYRRTDVSQAVTVALNFGSEPCQLVTDAGRADEDLDLEWLRP